MDELMIYKITITAACVVIALAVLFILFGETTSKPYNPDACEDGKYKLMVVSRDTWNSTAPLSSIDGWQVIEGFHDLRDGTPVLVLRKPDALELCPHGDSYDDCPECRH